MLDNSLLELRKFDYQSNIVENTETPYLSRLHDAIMAWKNLLGEDSVSYRTEDLGKNTIGSKRKIPSAVVLQSAEEISAALKIAQKYKIKVYPISTGNNWGYGSAMPVTDQNVIFDLRKMNRILNFYAELGTVTVEPGVTQKMLYEFLKAKNSLFMVPVTGAGPDCSILGNALERGYGITPQTDHFAAVHSLKAVLPNGELYCSHFTSMNAEQIDQLHKWGLGPYLDGIFSQSNMGIVTEVTINLKKKTEAIEMFAFKIKNDEKLEQTVKIINEILNEVGENLSGINLMNDVRVTSMSADYPFEVIEANKGNSKEILDQVAKKLGITPWTGIGAIYGTKAVVKAVKKVIKAKLRSVDKFPIFMNRKRINFVQKVQKMLPFLQTPMLNNLVEKVESTLNILEGIPQKVAIPLAYWKNKGLPYRGHDKNHNPALDNCGLIWFTPLIPLRPKDIRKYTDIVKKVCRANNIEPLITMTTLSEKVVDSSVPILFDRNNPEDCKNAKQCYLDLYAVCKKEGYLPYRMGVDHMHLATNQDSTYWNFVKKIKDTIDPENILSPGRYCPLE